MRARCAPRVVRAATVHRSALILDVHTRYLRSPPHPAYLLLFSAPLILPLCCCKPQPASPLYHQSPPLETIMAGRGRGRTLPAWMTDDAAPGSAPAPAPSFSAPAPASSASSPPPSAAQSSNVAVAPPPQRQAPPGMMPGDEDSFFLIAIKVIMTINPLPPLTPNRSAILQHVRSRCTQNTPPPPPSNSNIDLRHGHAPPHDEHDGRTASRHAAGHDG